MKKHFKPLLFLALSFNTFNAFTQNNNCLCSANLDTLIFKTEANYAGFPKKVNKVNHNTYKLLVASLKKSAASVIEAKPCFAILSKYVQFFYDRHFNISYYNEKDVESEIVKITEADFKKRFQNKMARHQLEGIWINQDSSLKLGILQYPGQIFKAIVLEAKNPKIPSGLVYMTISRGSRGFTVKYYNSFSSTQFPVNIKGNLLQGWTYELFGKIYPTHMSNAEQKELSTWKHYNNGLDFYKISPKTAVLKIPSFANNDNTIAALISNNDSIIRSSENLIVDVTGNGGGSTGWVSFLPYFMTKPIAQQNGYVRVSAENVRLKLADIEPYVLNPIPAEYEKYFPDTILSHYKKAYEELPGTKATFYPVPGVIFPLDSITHYPKKIALVVDHLCGSSTEYFVFLSKQSDKARTYGVNTFGMMDYEGASSTPLPYAGFNVSIPIVKSSWTDTKPIDKTGFSPDIDLSKIPQEQWLEYIRLTMEK
ncbi:MAG TPA: S41 family peptidase [Ferruginibacter sp.]|nr:S41 family peptidase [Ferruginibacter sp.]HMP20680.1 S41 family peptidase [Ferruginibacter sp.]